MFIFFEFQQQAQFSIILSNSEKFLSAERLNDCLNCWHYSAYDFTPASRVINPSLITKRPADG